MLIRRGMVAYTQFLNALIPCMGFILRDHTLLLITTTWYMVRYFTFMPDYDLYLALSSHGRSWRFSRRWSSYINIAQIRCQPLLAPEDFGLSSDINPGRYSNFSRHRTSRDSGKHQTSRDSGKHQIPRDSGKHQTPRDSGKHQTPRDSGKLQTSRDSGKLQTPRDSGKHQTPRDSGKLQTPRDSGKHQTPRDSGKHQTPRDSGKHQTPRDSGKLQTPRDSGKHQTPLTQVSSCDNVLGTSQNGIQITLRLTQTGKIITNTRLR